MKEQALREAVRAVGGTLTYRYSSGISGRVYLIAGIPGIEGRYEPLQDTAARFLAWRDRQRTRYWLVHYTSGQRVPVEASVPQAAGRGTFIRDVQEIPKADYEVLRRYL